VTHSEIGYSVGYAPSADSTPRDIAPLLRNLARLARMLAQVTTLEQLVEIAAEEVQTGLASSTVSLSRLEPGTGTLRTLINVGDLGPQEERWPRNEVYSLQNFLKLRGIVSDLQMWTVTVNDTDADRCELELLAELGKEAAMAAPVIVNNTLWGELYVTYASADQAFAAEDQAYVEVYLAIVESALTNLVQIQSLERLAFQDPLTGLSNRRALDEAATKAFDLLADRNMLRINVVSIDLNGLKHVNDTGGHAEGDRLITSAGAIIRKHFNGLPGSLVSRVGGDEFVVLVPSHNTEIVAAAARAACAAIAALPVGEGASCGVAAAGPTHIDASMAQLFRRADAAQYLSKRSGRPVIVDVLDGSPPPTDRAQPESAA
jgi:diguanylate cyclase (GGDEF)-like protein